MARLLEVTVHSNKKCGPIERILDADSNQPPLTSIREQELSKKKTLQRGAWSISHGKWYVLPSSRTASVSDVEFVAEISYCVLFSNQERIKAIRNFLVVLSGARHFAVAVQWASYENWFQSSHSDMDNTKEMFPWKVHNKKSATNSIPETLAV